MFIPKKFKEVDEFYSNELWWTYNGISCDKVFWSFAIERGGLIKCNLM